jgi:HAE1 family hydrophobic/amphiphilic exporter-1
MGSTVIGGMLAATGIAIFIIPVTFYVVEKISGKKGRQGRPPRVWPREVIMRKNALNGGQNA